MKLFSCLESPVKNLEDRELSIHMISLLEAVKLKLKSENFFLTDYIYTVTHDMLSLSRQLLLSYSIVTMHAEQQYTSRKVLFWFLWKTEIAAVAAQSISLFKLWNKGRRTYSCVENRGIKSELKKWTNNLIEDWFDSHVTESFKGLALKSKGYCPILLINLWTIILVRI